jgi:serine/threonine-protein kinase
MAGGSLAARLVDGPLPVGPGIRLLAQVADGLAALHEAGVVHRDLKPANVLLEPDGTAAIGDLGLARGGRDTVLTRPGQVLGTLEYLAPEVIRGQPASRASDIYALGCLVYAVLTGQPPFSGGGTMRTAFAHLQEPPPDLAGIRPELGEAMAAAVRPALAKEPDERPGSAVAYVAALTSG